MIKAIETRYNGYRFRSRLEARWAVFFDALGIEYQYEPEGFDLGEAGWYLPDFWLPKQKCWIEIKGEKPSPDEKEHCYCLSVGREEAVYLFYGMPGIQDFTNTNEGYYCQTNRILLFAGEAWDTWQSPSWGGQRSGLFYWELKFDKCRLPEFLHMHFPDLSIPQQAATTPQERKRLIQLDEKYYCAQYGTLRHPFYEYGRYINEDDLTFMWENKSLLFTIAYTLPGKIGKALLAARQARFEHGETPKGPRV